MDIGMSMRMDFENPIDIDVSMEMTFENEYECGYNFTHSIPTPCSSLRERERVWGREGERERVYKNVTKGVGG